MKNEKLLDKLGGLLESSEKADAKHIKKLRKVLQKLKKRQQELAAKLENTEGEHDRRRINQEIEVLKLQRKKGAVVYKTLKKGTEKSSEPES